jgi:hypothetical protein
MKKSDIAMIVLIASLSILSSYFVGNAIVGDRKNESVKVKVTEAITTAVEQPSKETFNENAINPTVEVIIGGDGQPQATN